MDALTESPEPVFLLIIMATPLCRVLLSRYLALILMIDVTDCQQLIFVKTCVLGDNDQPIWLLDV